MHQRINNATLLIYVGAFLYVHSTQRRVNQRWVGRVAKTGGAPRYGFNEVKCETRSLCDLFDVAYRRD